LLQLVYHPSFGLKSLAKLVFGGSSRLAMLSHALQRAATSFHGAIKCGHYSAINLVRRVLVFAGILSTTKIMGESTDYKQGTLRWAMRFSVLSQSAGQTSNRSVAAL